MGVPLERIWPASAKTGDVLFIDEIHGLETRLAECLYQEIDEKCLCKANAL